MGSPRTRTVLCFLIVVVLFGTINTERSYKGPQNRHHRRGHKKVLVREKHKDSHENEQNEETYTKSMAPSHNESIDEPKSHYVPELHDVEDHNMKRPERTLMTKHKSHRIQKRVQPKTRIALKQGEEDDKKKNTHVAFVLYNREIKFLKQDQVHSEKSKTAIKFNCVLIVTESNKCWGFEMSPSNNKTQARLRKRLKQGKKKLRSRKASPVQQLPQSIYTIFLN